MDNRINTTIKTAVPNPMSSVASASSQAMAASADPGVTARSRRNGFADTYGELSKEVVKASTFTRRSPTQHKAANSGGVFTEQAPAVPDDEKSDTGRSIFDKVVDAAAEKAKSAISTARGFRDQAKEKILEVLDRHTGLVNLNEARKKAGLGSIYPDATLITGKGSLAMLAGKVAGIDILVNSESGEVSFFGFGGMEAGLITPGLSAGLGKVWNMEENDAYAGWSVDATLGASVASVTAFACQPDDVPLFDADLNKGLHSPHGFVVNPVSIEPQDLAFIPNASASKTYAVQAPVTIPLLGYLLDPKGTFFNWLD